MVRSVPGRSMPRAEPHGDSGSLRRLPSRHSDKANLVAPSSYCASVQTMPTAMSRLDESAVAEAVEAFREQVDVLLDRVADRIINTPAAGSASWHATWRNRGSEDGRIRLRQHLLARIAVAHHLGLDTAPDVLAALAAGATIDDIHTQAIPWRRPNDRVRRPRRIAAVSQLQLFDT